MANVDTSKNGGAQLHQSSISEGFGTRAVDAVTETASNAAESSAKMVKKYPLTSVGAAFAGGALLGAIAYRLLAPKPTWYERLGLLALANGARSQAKHLKDMF